MNNRINFCYERVNLMKFLNKIALTVITVLSSQIHVLNTMDESTYSNMFSIEFNDGTKEDFSADVLKTSRTIELDYLPYLSDDQNYIPLHGTNCPLMEKNDFTEIIYPLMEALFKNNSADVGALLGQLQEVRTFDHKFYKRMKKLIKYLDFGLLLGSNQNKRQYEDAFTQKVDNELIEELAKKREKLLRGALPRRQPVSLKDQAAKVSFTKIAQQEHPKNLLQTLPKELVEEYINKPIDRARRTPLYYATTQQQVEELTDELENYKKDYYALQDIVEQDTAFVSALKHGKREAAIAIYNKEKINAALDVMGNRAIDTVKLIYGKDTGAHAHRNTFYSSDNYSNLKQCAQEVESIIAQENFSLPEQMGRNEFFYLAHSQNLSDDIQKLLEKGANINHQDKWGNTPLIFALKCLKRDVVEALFNAGADVTSCDQVGRDALTYAVILNYNSLIERFVERSEPDVLGFDQTYCDLLEIAVQYNIDALFIVLKMYDYEPKRLNLPLKKAAQCNPDAIDLLITAGADVITQDSREFNEDETIDSGKNTPLMVAARNKENPEAVRKLLARGADPNIKRENKEHTALGNAVLSCNNAVIKDLIDAGANINDTSRGKYILHSAATGNAEVIRYLLDASTQQLQVNVQDEDGITALMKLILYNEVDDSDAVIDAFKALLKAGADINLKDHKGETVLNRLMNYYTSSDSSVDQGLTHYKNYSIDNENLKLVLGSGADPNTINKMGDTPLMNLFRKTNFETICGVCIQPDQYNIDGILTSIQLLIKTGTDVTIKNNNGYTLFHQAVLTAQPRVIKFLLEQEIDCNVQDNNGNTPIMIVVEHFNELSNQLKKWTKIGNKKVSEIQADLKERYQEIIDLLWTKTDLSIINNRGESAEAIVKMFVLT
jgi:ankyrin repeat protein